MRIQRIASLILGLVFGIQGCGHEYSGPLESEESRPALHNGTGPRGYSPAVAADVQHVAYVLAEGLGDPHARGRLATALANSTAPEGKLQFRAFLRSSTAAVIVTAIAERTSTDARAIRDLFARVPDLDVYLPFAQHRETWDPTEPIAVAALVDEVSPVYAHLPNGQRSFVDRQSTVPTETALLLLGPAELERRSTPSLTQSPCPTVEVNLATCGGGGGGSGGTNPYLRADSIRTQGVCDNNFCGEGNEFEFIAQDANGTFMNPRWRCTSIPSTGTVYVPLHPHCESRTVHFSAPGEVAYVDVKLIETDMWPQGDDEFTDYLTPGEESPGNPYVWRDPHIENNAEGRRAYVLFRYPEGVDCTPACYTQVGIAFKW